MATLTPWMFGGSLLLIACLATLTLVLCYHQKAQTRQLDHLKRLLALERQTNEFYGHLHRQQQRIVQAQTQSLQALQRQLESIKQLIDN